jgi:hypothetical protein
MARKEEREDRRVESGPTAGGRSAAEQRDQNLEAMTRSIDETKENIKRSTEEARKEMPRYSQTMTDLQSQTIDATREISENFLDSQKEVINSMRYTWSRYPRRDMAGMWPMYPREVSETYGRWISSVADYSVAATRMANNMMHAALETARISTNYAKENAKEMSRVTGNFARSLSKDAAERGW